MSNLGLITHAEKLITLSTLLLDSTDGDRVRDLCLPRYCAASSAAKFCLFREGGRSRAGDMEENGIKNCRRGSENSQCE